MNRLIVLVGASLTFAVGTLPVLAEPPIPGYNSPEFNLNRPRHDQDRGAFERGRGEDSGQHRHHRARDWYQSDE